MSPAPPCPHGFPSAGSCIDCMADDGLGADPAPATESPFVRAEFRTYCARCPGNIIPGDMIGIYGVTGRWAHAGCLR